MSTLANNRRRTGARAVPLTIALCAVAACAGCSTVESLIPSPSKGDTGYTDPSVRVTGVPASSPSNRPDPNSPGVRTLPLSAEDLGCPTVDVADGGAALRAGGPANASVRYQFNIVDTARQCDPQGTQASLKIGVSGNLLIGPAGSPGAYGAPLRVTIKRISDEKTVFAKVYRAEADTRGGAEGAFQIVTEPIVIPMGRPQLDLDYEITIGFEGAGSGVRQSRVR